MKTYPCEINKGDIMVMKNGRRYIVESFDGRYIYTHEGNQFKPTHPDILGFEEKTEKKHVEEYKSYENNEKSYTNNESNNYYGDKNKKKRKFY